MRFTSAFVYVRQKGGRSAGGVEEAKPTKAQLSASPRVVAKLVAEGRAEVPPEREWDGEGDGWYRRRYVKVRRTSTAADEARREELMRPYIEAAEARAQAIPYAIDTGSRGVVEVEVEPVFKITTDGVELREERAEGAPTAPAWVQFMGART